MKSAEKSNNAHIAYRLKSQYKESNNNKNKHLKKNTLL